MKTESSFSSLLEKARMWHAEACARLGFTPANGLGRPDSPPTIAGRIEHTFLKLDITDIQIQQMCREAIDYRFRSVCCLPADVARCRKILGNSGVLVVTTVNFPFFGSDPKAAELECRIAAENGADEIDTLIDVRSLRSGDLAAARDSVARMVRAASGRPVKAILETGLLEQRTIAEGAAASEAGGARFVKTSTGFGPRGASEEDIAILRAAVSNRLGIKASGGIREPGFARRLVELGADLIGTSSGPACIS